MTPAWKKAFCLADAKRWIATAQVRLAMTLADVAMP